MLVVELELGGAGFDAPTGLTLEPVIDETLDNGASILVRRTPVGSRLRINPRTQPATDITKCTGDDLVDHADAPASAK